MENVHFTNVSFSIEDVPSSFILTITYKAYNLSWGDLMVTFRKGYTYHYEKVEMRHALEFLTALDDNESLGMVFQDNIRERYEGKRTDLANA